MELALLEKFSQDFQNSKDFIVQKSVNTIDTITAVTNQTKDSLSKSTEQAKELVIQTSNTILNNLNQETNQAISKLTEASEKANISVTQAATNINETSKNAVRTIGQTAQKAKDTISHTSVQAIDSVNHAANKAAMTVSDITDKAKEAVATSTNLAVKSVTETTNQAISNINQVSQQAKTSLEETIQKTEALSRSLTEGIENGINGFMSDWMLQHQTLAWFLNHPLYSILILVLSVVLIWGLIQALSGLIVKAWTSVLLSPFKLIKPFLRIGSKSAVTAMNNGFVSMKLDSTDPKEQFNYILNRLNEIKQEENNLLQQLEKIVAASDLNLKVK